MSKQRLDELRTQIDGIDTKLLYLFNQRAELVVEVARIKHELGLRVFDPEREREIFMGVTTKNAGPFSQEAIIRLFERVIDESRSLERSEVYDKHGKGETE